MSQRYDGSCHCGAVRFEFTAPTIDRGMRCNCSLCVRRGAVMSSDVIPREAFRIDADADALGLYQFGEKTAKHYFCKHCGIYTFHESGRFPGKLRANLGCVEGVDSLALEWELFDGRHEL